MVAGLQQMITGPAVQVWRGTQGTRYAEGGCVRPDRIESGSHQRSEAGREPRLLPDYRAAAACAAFAGGSHLKGLLTHISKIGQICPKGMVMHISAKKSAQTHLICFSRPCSHTSQKLCMHISKFCSYTSWRFACMNCLHPHNILSQSSSFSTASLHSCE